MILKVEYKRDRQKELKSKKICCLNGLNRYKGKECIRGSKGLNEEILNKIIYKNIKENTRTLDRDTIRNLIVKEQNEVSNACNNKELLNKELEKIDNEIKILYSDYKEKLLNEEDYKKYYKEKCNQRNRVKKELEILVRKENNKKIITNDEINKLIEDILDRKEFNKNIISEMIYDIRIDNDNQIYIYYKYNVFRMVA